MNPLTLALALAFAAPDDCGIVRVSFGDRVQVSGYASKGSCWSAWYREWCPVVSYSLQVRFLPKRNDAGVTLGVCVNELLEVKVNASYYGWVDKGGWWHWEEMRAAAGIVPALTELHP